MHVGVFLINTVQNVNLSSLPHARGGVSNALFVWLLMVMSSPCTWGCFPSLSYTTGHNSVFPMHVGVFPPYSRIYQHSLSLPHARGGVSNKH